MHDEDSDILQKAHCVPGTLEGWRLDDSVPV